MDSANRSMIRMQYYAAMTIVWAVSHFAQCRGSGFLGVAKQDGHWNNGLCSATIMLRLNRWCWVFGLGGIRVEIASGRITVDQNGEIDPRLLVVRESPLNAETPLCSLDDLVTPTPLFYIRNHFPLPDVREDSWCLTVDGEVERALTLSRSEVVTLPELELAVTIECAGNGRTYFSPNAEGEQWSYGAIGNAVWTGTPLKTVLEMARLKPSAVELLATGSDSGILPDGARRAPFERSLPIEMAIHPDTLLAWAMNGEPLMAVHGYPLRLIVPGWYGMAAVKWLTRISALPCPFDGFYQKKRYVMSEKGNGPLTRIEPRALITSPADGSRLEQRTITVSGFAVSGSAPVERVEVSLDGGVSWESAKLIGPCERYAWRHWEYDWQPANRGSYRITVRATDATGSTQPVEASWNRLGYKNNSRHGIEVAVMG